MLCDVAEFVIDVSRVTTGEHALSVLLGLTHLHCTQHQCTVGWGWLARRQANVSQTVPNALYCNSHCSNYNNVFPTVPFATNALPRSRREWKEGNVNHLELIAL